MKLIFICSPYAGDVELNTNRARRYCRFAHSRGHLPFAPHLLFPQFLDDNDPEERQAGIKMGLSMLGFCNELWCFGREVSPGMAAEIKWAEKLKIPVRRFTTSCEEVPQT